MKVEQKTGPGRPETIAPEIRKSIALCRTMTPKKFVEHIFPKVQGKMRGGVTTDAATVKKQKNTIYQTVLRVKNEAIEAGKRVEYMGKKNSKGELKRKWVR